MSAVTLTTTAETPWCAGQESAEAVVPAGVSTPTHQEGCGLGRAERHAERMSVVAGDGHVDRSQPAQAGSYASGGGREPSGTTGRA